MDIDKIEKIIAELAKNGDRETISLICNLLTEVSKFKKAEKKSNLTEMVRESVETHSGKDTKSYASLILDELPDNYVPDNIGNKSNGASEMMNHAANLF